MFAVSVRFAERMIADFQSEIKDGLMAMAESRPDPHRKMVAAHFQKHSAECIAQCKIKPYLLGKWGVKLW